MQSSGSILDIPTISETESTRFHSRTDLNADEADLVSKCHPLDRSMGGTNRPRQVADRSRRASAPFGERLRQAASARLQNWALLPMVWVDLN